jgi:ATP-dependent DNA ligase
LRARPIGNRKASLAELLRERLDKKSRPQEPAKSSGIRQVVHLFDTDAALIFEHASRLGCEGIVSKLRGSRYIPGRTRDWVKTKNPNAPWARRLQEEDWK